MKTITYDERSWKLVPVEPTNADLSRAIETTFQVTVDKKGLGPDGTDWKGYMYVLWTAVIAAAPTPPQEQNVQDLVNAQHVRTAAEIIGALTNNLEDGHPAKEAVSRLLRIADRIEAGPAPRESDHA